MFTTSWNGSRVPNEAAEKEVAKASRLARNTSIEKEEDAVKGGGEVWYVEGKGEGKWVTEWRCKLPISEFNAGEQI